MRFGIIYRVTCLVTGKVYIGQTTNLKERWYFHLYAAEKGSKFKFSNAIRKYGKENFKFEIIIKNIPEDCLNCLEILTIHLYDSYNTGYNSTLGGGAFRGYIITEEVRAKMSASKKGIRHSEETKQKMRISHLGVKKSPECIAKLILAHKGIPKHSEETKKHLSAIKKGTKDSEETKQKKRLSMLGKNRGPHSEERRQHNREAQTGLIRGPYSEEHRKKISDAKKGRPGRIWTEEERTAVSRALKGVPKPRKTKETIEKQKRTWWLKKQVKELFEFCGKGGPND